MARSPRVLKSGVSFFAFIFFIVLSAILLIACFWFVSLSVKRGGALVQLQKDIKDNLEDPLSRGLGVSAKSTASASDVAYGSDFFGKVGKAGAKGIKYDDLIKVVGYEGDDSPSQITTDLTGSGVQPVPGNLRNWISALKGQVGDLERSAIVSRETMSKAISDRDAAQKDKDDAVKRADAARDEKEQKLAAARKEYEKELSALRQAVSKAADDAKNAWAQLNAQTETNKSEKASLQNRIKNLEQEVRVAMDALQRKKPAKAAAILEGHVLVANTADALAVIDLGKREGIQNGEKFSVINIGRAGEKNTKADLTIIRVDDLVATAEITNSDPDNPIMIGDPIERQKKTE